MANSSESLQDELRILLEKSRELHLQAKELDDQIERVANLVALNRDTEKKPRADTRRP